MVFVNCGVRELWRSWTGAWLLLGCVCTGGSHARFALLLRSSFSLQRWEHDEYTEVEKLAVELVAAKEFTAVEMTRVLHQERFLPPDDRQGASHF